jgi:hypothetical protein
MPGENQKSLGSTLMGRKMFIKKTLPRAIETRHPQLPKICGQSSKYRKRRFSSGIHQ